MKTLILALLLILSGGTILIMAILFAPALIDDILQSKHKLKIPDLCRGSCLRKSETEGLDQTPDSHLYI